MDDPSALSATPAVLLVRSCIARRTGGGCQSIRSWRGWPEPSDAGRRTEPFVPEMTKGHRTTVYAPDTRDSIPTFINAGIPQHLSPITVFQQSRRGVMSTYHSARTCLLTLFLLSPILTVSPGFYSPR
jgi:hypothetical protein